MSIRAGVRGHVQPMLLLLPFASLIDDDLDDLLRLIDTPQIPPVTPCSFLQNESLSQYYSRLNIQPTDTLDIQSFKTPALFNDYHFHVVAPNFSPSATSHNAIPIPSAVFCEILFPNHSSLTPGYTRQKKIKKLPIANAASNPAERM